MTALSLYTIEDSLVQLAELRELAEAEGDSEAVKVIDAQLAAYLTAEASKINSYVGLIRAREDRAEACDREIERITSIRNAAKRDVERLKANALQVMQDFGVKSLVDSRTGRGLKRQGNGGVQALEIADVKLLPEDLQLKSVTMNVKAWHEIGQWLGKYNGGLDWWHKILSILEGQPPQASTHFIRATIQQGGTVEGAKLLPRAEHVRVI